MRLCFVVPCKGRHAIATACLRQLARTCAEVTSAGVESSAILTGDERFFQRLAGELGFGWWPARNRPLGRKWNDGIEYACREARADYVVPFGSDDAIDARLIRSAPLPGLREIRCARLSAVVSPDGRELATLRIPYRGGDGIRVIPAALLARVRYRPAVEERSRGIDGSMSDRLTRAGVHSGYVYHDLHALQIVDFKSPVQQLNGYAECLAYATARIGDPFGALAQHYPPAFLDELQTCYSPRRVRV